MPGGDLYMCEDGTICPLGVFPRLFRTFLRRLHPPAEIIT